jgi:hypothetical protein
MRQLGDVQVRMRLKVSGDKSDIYIPELYPHIVRPLMEDGTVSCPLSILSLHFHLLASIYQQSTVQDVVERMDEYYLSKEDSSWVRVTVSMISSRRLRDQNGLHEEVSTAWDAEMT